MFNLIDVTVVLLLSDAPLVNVYIFFVCLKTIEESQIYLLEYFYETTTMWCFIGALPHLRTTSNNQSHINW